MVRNLANAGQWDALNIVVKQGGVADDVITMAIDIASKSAKDHVFERSVAE